MHFLSFAKTIVAVAASFLSVTSHPIAPPHDILSVKNKRDSTLVSIAFLSQLNWNFVSQNSAAKDEIENLMPGIINYAVGGSCTGQGITQSGTATVFTALVDSDLAEALQLQIQLPVSKFYNNPDDASRALSLNVDPSYPIITGDTPSPVSSGIPAPASSEVPSPASSEAPSPASSEAPSPASSEAPSPASSEAPQALSSSAPAVAGNAVVDISSAASSSDEGNSFDKWVPIIVGLLIANLVIVLALVTLSIVGRCRKGTGSTNSRSNGTLSSFDSYEPVHRKDHDHDTTFKDYDSLSYGH
ncbi:hypothetical protein DL96DRAFT_242745 [Flagelloscypha sp. PMI_526]|nr:hypothetical protein DL96DRAFT_242745 [Flagelloscypha sp. PMI_526]